MCLGSGFKLHIGYVQACINIVHNDNLSHRLAMCPFPSHICKGCCQNLIAIEKIHTYRERAPFVMDVRRFDNTPTGSQHSLSPPVQYTMPSYTGTFSSLLWPTYPLGITVKEKSSIFQPLGKRITFLACTYKTTISMVLLADLNMFKVKG